ncbi:hypothetical protein [Luteimonas wenzhouensis]|uniref:Uncharacterized protein n=1 Tax=Luteimonas wenzhouensis TaxID=2599615 RepID=A0A5C5U5N3_9GAMM|nr:hypothetical protein [Luteimonas wenzhouensis]TWT21651.1 hypothetical protein FQY79_00490 [Luteimonas wenzhouensis]
MRFGPVARLSPAEYARFQRLVRMAARKRARVERPEVEGETFRLLRNGEVLAESEHMDLIQRVLMDL